MTINTINRPLKYGCIGMDVIWLQTQLTQNGYFYNKIDGIFKDTTQLAVKQYQSSHSLPITGIADEQTLTLLGAIYDPR